MGQDKANNGQQEGKNTTQILWNITLDLLARHMSQEEVSSIVRLHMAEPSYISHIAHMSPIDWEGLGRGYARSQQADDLMEEVSNQTHIPMSELDAMRSKLNSIPISASGKGVDVVYLDVLKTIQCGAEFGSIKRAFDSLEHKKFACLVDDQVGEVIKQGVDLKDVHAIFENMSLENCKKLAYAARADLRFEEIYPYLVSCNIEKLNQFVAEIPEMCGMNYPGFKALVQKYGCGHGDKTKAADRDTTKHNDVNVIKEDDTEELDPFYRSEEPVQQDKDQAQVLGHNDTEE